MNLTQEELYRALASRDRRFDGVFFVGITSTGIYCRPICPARTPKAGNCRFFQTAPEAERSGFRPCLRCRPELAPGLAPSDSVSRAARIASARIASGAVGDGSNLESLAADLGLGVRQLRRIVKRELGATPIELVQSHRLLLAKRLLADTQMTIAQVAFASGFQSIRRFNSLFAARYRIPPSRLRKTPATVDHVGTIRLTLTYRPPYAWEAMLGFLEKRAMPGVEAVYQGAYLRSVRLGGVVGWVRIVHDSTKNRLVAEASHELQKGLPELIALLKNAFDLDARPDVVLTHLGQDPVLGTRVRALPGLRVPGAMDGFELAVRAILGQRISVSAASTLASRLCSAFCEPLAANVPQLYRAPLAPERLATVSVQEFAALGIPEPKAKCLVAIAARSSPDD